MTDDRESPLPYQELLDDLVLLEKWRPEKLSRIILLGFLVHRSPGAAACDGHSFVITLRRDHVANPTSINTNLSGGYSPLRVQNVVFGGAGLSQFHRPKTLGW